MKGRRRIRNVRAAASLIRQHLQEALLVFCNPKRPQGRIDRMNGS